ncbi:phosphoadenylyl-sulfate reductase [Treponema sp. TIM-1]|uniref:phosphoadenylyl-sulfate reductase n=1 Tax=Treponema sp. TIM-1 TaxID=2898417 RepID=UPI00397FDB3B
MSSDDRRNDKGAEALSRILRAIRGPAALAFSYQAEDAAALHLLLGCGGAGVEVFTLNTNRLFPETAAYHREVELFFNIPIHQYYPEAEEEEKLEAELGEWGMRESLEKRRRCCEVRKVRPLARILAGKNAWVTGLRAAQSVTRSDLKLLEYDEQFGLVKINPLADWSDEDLAAYIERYRIPLNPLYAEGFKSIGCAPCTRAVREGEDIRSGRWWWELPDHKECGLHARRAAGG